MYKRVTKYRSNGLQDLEHEDIEIGDTVLHNIGPQGKVGKVLAINGERLTVRFPGGRVIDAHANTLAYMPNKRKIAERASFVRGLREADEHKEPIRPSKVTDFTQIKYGDLIHGVDETLWPDYAEYEKGVITRDYIMIKTKKRGSLVRIKFATYIGEKKVPYYAQELQESELSLPA